MCISAFFDNPWAWGFYKCTIFIILFIIIFLLLSRLFQGKKWRWRNEDKMETSEDLIPPLQVCLWQPKGWSLPTEKEGTMCLLMTLLQQSAIFAVGCILTSRFTFCEVAVWDTLLHRQTGILEGCSDHRLIAASLKFLRGIRTHSSRF